MALHCDTTYEFILKMIKPSLVARVLYYEYTTKLHKKLDVSNK
jgi:hypothetical protein